MSALLSSIALLAFGWILHVVWWRVRLPQHQMSALLFVFAVAPIFSVVGWLLAGQPDLLVLQDLPAVILFYLGGLGCYLIAYTGVEERSPSLAIIDAIENAGAGGCSSEMLSQVITDDNFIKPRIEALKRDGMLTATNGGFVLSARGKQAAKTSLMLSRIFNIQKNA